MKLFKKNENEVMQDPIIYLNKKKDRRFLFFTKWGGKPLSNNTKKILKRVSLVVLPVLAIALGTTLGIIANNNTSSDELVNNVIIDTNISKRRVYLLTDDNLTVPLTVSLDKKNNVYEEMLDVINLCKVSSKASNEYIHGYLVEETKVNAFTLNQDNNLNIDFSNEFLSEDSFSKDKKLEAFIATMMQFDNVDSVSVTINGEKYLEKQNTTFLNKIYHSPLNLENKDLVTVFYERKIEDFNYMIPVSIYADAGESANITFVNGLFKKMPSKMMLNNLSIYENISKNQTQKDSFSLTVNSSALIDEETVNKELYEMVLLSLDLMQMENKVSFDIEGETLQVEGIYQEEDIPVSSIYYNEAQI